ncbi:hypothetical protein ACFQ1E_08115 [Sphingomonas canadensis]|uniref:Uncharacterized protein n=1 Tax=Sphingomonas canadensis TaxID=1219257 RepID=A0ABW3HA30_9SPHN|nr:hypothetical protein [Sphingomonas canadensis]MCW3836001.1 hypothetical protein [Sphingomonas canadensis]
MPAEFETDLDPKTGWPRVRFNFANGWSASLVIRVGTNGFDAQMASVAACPTGEWGTGQTILGPTEATADEALAWIDQVRRDWTAITANPAFETEKV